MSNNSVCRTLISDIEAEVFVDNILQIENMNLKREAINSIVGAERNIITYTDNPTWDHKDNRDFEYRDDKTRNKLRSQIIEELCTLKRLNQDDDIKLGKGGALPLTKIKSEKKLFYVIGPPASGKSGIANDISDSYGAVLLDSDYVKRKLPEYNNQIGAATLVHEESDRLIFDYKQKSLLDFCIQRGYNIVVPKIGHSIDGILAFCKMMKTYDYSVYLISVDLDRQLATQRAYYRFKKTRRYVPLALIFDGYSNQPTLNYYKMLQLHGDMLNGYSQISTDVDFGDLPILIEQKNMKKMIKLYGGA